MTRLKTIVGVFFAAIIWGCAPKPKIKEIISWVEEETPRFLKPQYPDTIHFYLDTLGRTVFSRIAYHPSSDGGWSCDSTRYIYNTLDSLIKEICYKPMDKKGIIHTRTYIYDRDTIGRIITTKKKYSKYPSLNQTTQYRYDTKGRVIEIIEQKDDEFKPIKTTMNVYIDSTATTISTVYFRQKLLHSDTISYNQDSSLVRTSKHWMGKGNNAIPGRCVKCLRYIKYDNDQVREITEILPPTDTIFHKIIQYDRRNNLTQEIIKTKTDTLYIAYEMKFNKKNHHKKTIQTTNGKWAATYHEIYHYY